MASELQKTFYIAAGTTVKGEASFVIADNDNNVYCGVIPANLDNANDLLEIIERAYQNGHNDIEYGLGFHYTQHEDHDVIMGTYSGHIYGRADRTLRSHFLGAHHNPTLTKLMKTIENTYRTGHLDRCQTNARDYYFTPRPS